MSPVFGTPIIPVAPGTVIKDDAGNEAVVDETHAVQKGGSIYVTPTVLEAIKAHPNILDTGVAR